MRSAWRRKLRSDRRALPTHRSRPGSFDEALAEANDVVAVAAAKHVEQKELSIPLALRCCWQDGVARRRPPRSPMQQAINAIDSEAQLQPKKSTTEKSIAQLQARKLRLTQERERLNAPEDAELIAIDEQLDGRARRARSCRADGAGGRGRSYHADEERAHRRAELDVAQRKLGELRARENAIGSVQAKFGNRGKASCSATGSTSTRFAATNSGRNSRVDAGWEDAVEAVLRDRLNALPVASLEEAMRLPDRPRG